MADGESKPTSLLGTLTAVAATIGAFIAVGQAASEAVRGYYTAQMENKRAEQQLQIETLKTQSDLAKDYLGIIFKSETSRPDRIALFGALTTLSGHPLQPWAEAQFAEETRKLNEVEKARESQLEHAREGVADELSTITDKLVLVQAEYKMAPHDTSDVLHGRLLELVIRQGALKAATTAAAAPPIPGETRLSIDELDRRLTIGAIRKAFPHAPEGNIAANLPPLLAAIREFDLLDPRLIAATLATIRAETEGFVPWAEGLSPFNTKVAPFDLYEPRFEKGTDLGNTEAGDGARFKGRGYVQLTGRARYAAMSETLGLRTLLIDNPDLASDPEMSARILCASIGSKRQAILESADAGDIRRVRRLTNGGSHGFDRFEMAYSQVLLALTTSQSPG